MNPIKGLPYQKCMDKFFDPYFGILMNWANGMRSLRKVYQNFMIIFEDIWKREFVFYQALITFFHTGNLFHPECCYTPLIAWSRRWVILSCFFC